MKKRKMFQLWDSVKTIFNSKIAMYSQTLTEREEKNIFFLSNSFYSLIMTVIHLTPLFLHKAHILKLIMVESSAQPSPQRQRQVAMAVLKDVRLY